MMSNNIYHDFIGIVTVLYNSDEVLPDFFYSLSLQRNIEFKLYVIDNSDKATGANLASTLSQKYSINSEVVFNNKNLGVAAGNNQGIGLALRDNCTHVLFANNDIDFGDRVVEQLMDALRASNASAVSPKIYFYGTSKLWFAGGSLSASKAKNTHRFYGESDKSQITAITRITYAPTCFLLVKADVFDRVGLMDEKYFCYWDDTDFIFRFLRCGYVLIYAPEPHVNHKVSYSTGGESSTFSIYYMNRNRVYFARKNGKGIIKIVSLFYVVVTRLYRSLWLPSKSRATMISAICDGFKMSL